jgi:serine/threonine-protein kinase
MPTPTIDPALLVGGFGKLYELQPHVRDGLGRPTEAEVGGARQITEQPYQGGSMFYFLPLDRIYVLLGKNSGTWLRFDHDDLKDVPTPTPEESPQCEIALQGGFRLVWSSQADIRRQIGCATGPEPGLLEGAYQPFEHGVMLYSNAGLGRGKTIYVLYEGGSFERFDDPNQ